MSDQLKTLLAYSIGVTVLMCAWSVFKSWEPPIAVREDAATVGAEQPRRPHTAAPTYVAAD